MASYRDQRFSGARVAGIGAASQPSFFLRLLQKLKRSLRRIIWTILVSGVLFASYPVGHWVQACLQLPVRNYHIHGECLHVDRGQIKNILQDYFQKNILTLPLHSLVQQLDAVPWVKSVALTRHWPDTLDIELAELQPFARWGQSALISNTGLIFTPPDGARYTALPLLQGPDAQREVMIKRYQEFAQALKPLGWKVKTVILSPHMSWSFSLEQGEKVMLGRENTEQHLQRFLQVYPALQRAHSDHATVVDLRYNAGLAIAWHKKIESDVRLQ